MMRYRICGYCRLRLPAGSVACWGCGAILFEVSMTRICEVKK